ncbi:MAG TPA: AAA family ATPase [Pyrinomonadaceae bacterium]|jgi:pilus assembly protein CpaE
MQSLTFITLGRNAEGSKQIRDALDGATRVRVLADCSNPEELLADVLRLQPSAAVITLEADQSEKDFALIRKLVATSPRTAIVTAASDASPSLILGSIRSGAREFLQLPIIPEEFQTVLQRIEEFVAAERTSSSKSSRLVAVFSGKGGAGVSFLATNLAAAMDVPTLLMDLNLQAGDTASFLGLEPKYSLTDFVVNRTRLDDSLISSLLTPHSARLALLAAPLEAHEAEDINPAHVTEVLHLLRQRYECLVIDLQHTFDPITIAALDLADDILLIMTLDIPGIRSTKRALKVFERLGYPRGKVHVVVNRWSKNIDVELQKVEAHLDEQLIGFVPNDYRKVMESINMGRPLVQTDTSSKLTLEIKRIAALVSSSNHIASPQTRKRLLGSVFSRQSSTGPLELSEIADTA